MMDQQIQNPEDTKENIKEPLPMDPPKMKPVTREMEKEQEAKLRAKYPGFKGPGSNAFLQKRLSKGQKYFDSGDYNMAKAKTGGAASKPVPPSQKLLLPGSTGEHMATPDDIPHKKSGMIQSKLAVDNLS